jgi:hypothetical protein
MKINKYLLLLSTTLLLSQCREKQVGTDESIISTNIVVSIAEHEDIGPKKVFISAKTTTGYGCGNATIETEKITGENQFSIGFKKVVFPTYCTLQGGPATSSITLGTLANGDYALELKTPMGDNKGILRIDSTKITLVFDKLIGIEIPETSVKRIF